jgi:hypothetical protein
MTLSNENNVLRIILEKDIDYKFTAFYSEIIDCSTKYTFDFLHLDFSQNEYVTLPGAMYLFFTTQAVITQKKKQGIYLETSMSGYSDSVINILCSFGFVSIMKSLGNLKILPDLEQFNEFRISYLKKSIKNINESIKSIYWPISLIPRKLTNINFDIETRAFFNNFIEYFNAVVALKMIEKNNSDLREFIEKSFIKAINEATKNVWDHSESWGIASIQSNRSNKTTLCLFDFGVGFIESYIKRKGNYIRTYDEDKKVLEWLFQEGNTSRSEGNHGHGLSIIEKFTDITDGILLISTDTYLLRYQKKTGLAISRKAYYPGTQIMINF